MKSPCLVWFAAVLILAARFSFAQITVQPQDPSTPVHTGRWTSRLLKGGLFLEFDGIPIVKGGVVQLFSAGYGRGYYSSGAVPPTLSVEALPDGGRAYIIDYRFSEANANFQATQRIEVRADNSVRLSIRSRWDGLEPAFLEWNPVRLWADPLAGAPFEATVSGLSAIPNGLHGRVPLRPLPRAALANRVAADWLRMTIRIPALGDLMFSHESAQSVSESPVLLDGRSDPYMQQDRLFWLGFPNARLQPGEERTLTLTINLFPLSPVPPISPSGRDLDLSAPIRPVPDAIRPVPPLADKAGQPVIIPQPKHAAYTNGDLLLRGRLPLTIALPHDAAGQRAERAAREFVADVGAVTGVHWKEEPLTANRPWGRRGLLVTVLGEAALPHPLTPLLTDKTEGYTVIVTPQFAAVVGRDPAGAFYGLQTLRQLLRTENTPAHGVVVSRQRRSNPRILGADITDWPALPMRAAHLFVGKEALPFHSKLIDRIFSRYKMNTLFIECEYTRWESHPELWQPYSMDPDDLRQEIAYARDRFVEPIPLINSLGHSEWIFKNGQHLDIAEDVKSPHAYDAGNPDTYNFLFSVFGEAVDLFRPRYFHIGHDEVRVPSYDLFGKYPARPRNIEKGVTALFMEDTNRLADWLKERGIKPILWGDMLLHKSEGDPATGAEMTAANAPDRADAEKRRGLLPKEAIIADWRYEPGSEQRNGLDIFRAAGNETLGCAWFSPENIRGWARQAIAHEALGTIQTTWAGYDSKEALLDEEYRQFTAFVLAAEYAWSGTPLHPRLASSDPPSAEAEFLPYTAGEVFARSYREELPTSGSSPGWTIDLAAIANIRLAGRSDLASYVTGISPRPAGEQTGPSGPPMESSPSQNRPYVLRAPTSMKKPLLARDVGDEDRAGTGKPSPSPSPRRGRPGAGTRLRVVGEVHSQNSVNQDTSVTQTSVRIDPEGRGIMLSGLLLPDGLQYSEDGSPRDLPAAIRLPISRKARELAFVHATLHGLESGAQAAHYRIFFSDGQSVDVPLRYGREIRTLGDSSGEGAYSIERVPVEPSGVSLSLFRWRNPHPDLVIDRLEFRTDNPLASPILFAVTGVE